MLFGLGPEFPTGSMREYLASELCKDLIDIEAIRLGEQLWTCN